MRHQAAFVLLLLAALPVGCRNSEQHPALIGPYLGQEPPGLEPVLFVPGLISTGRQELSISFSPDGRDVYLLTTGPTYTPRYLLHSRMEERGWTDLAEVTFFSADREDSYPFVSPDGRRVFFNSSRPYEGAPERRHREIWHVDRTADGWGEPVRIRFGDTDRADGAFPSVAANGNLYFNGGSSVTGSDIYYSEFDGERYSEPIRLPDSVNSDGGDFHPFIAPDESYLLFDSVREEDNLGSNDIYIAFRNEDGSWSEAMNLGETVNTEASDLRPFVTADGEYLFFVSNRMVEVEHPATALSAREARDILDRPGNGHQDIYWVSADVIPERPSGQDE
jgi:Tol biopolymer transport system component